MTAQQARRAGNDGVRDILESIGEAIVAIDADGRVIDINAAAVALDRRARADVLGLSCWDAWPGLAGSPFETVIRAALEERRPAEADHAYRSLSRGELLWINMRSYPVAAGGAVLIYRDVTERRLAETRLRESEARQGFMLALGDRLRPLADPEAIKAVAAEALGVQLSVGRVGYGAVDPAEQTVTVGDDWRRGSEVASLSGESRILDGFGPAVIAELKAGRTLVVDDAMTDARAGDAYAPTWDSIGCRALIVAPLLSGERLAAILFVHEPSPRSWTEAEVRLVEDVARRTWEAVERARAEGAARENEARFRRIADSAPVPMWVTGVDRKRQFVNLAYLDFLGVGYEGALDFDWRTVIHPDDAPRIYREQSEKEAALTPFSLEARYRRADGAWRWLRSESQPRFGPSREHLGFIGVAYDVTAAKQAQADLERMNEVLEARVGERTAALQRLYDNAPVPLHSLDPQGLLISVSDRWLEFMGYANRDEVLGRVAADFMTAESHDRLTSDYWPRLLAAGHLEDAEYRMVKRSGEVADVLISSRLERDADDRFVRTMGAVVDVTARRRAEEQLRQAQKMEAVGQLTGGIAHDFNNLLTAVIGSLDLIRRRPGDADRQRRLLDTAMAGAERGAKLTRQLLAFSRTQKLTLEAVDVAAAVKGMRELLDRSVGPSIALRLELDETVGAALADANQLENALLNLAVNARDAMPEGGAVTVSARRLTVGGDDPELSPGAHVEVSVSDSGQGMTPEVLSRAFDPFFTTKETGKGTGLGLSQVYGFARQSGGTVRIDSAPGDGTRVRILLRAAAPAGPAEATPDADPELRGRERVLIVDDDAEVRSFLVACAEDLGYRVAEAPDGAEALARFAAEPFDLVLTDYAMPGMTGAELARRLRANRPDLPIIFATGYADMDALSAAVGDAPVLRKPFGLADLAAALRAALARG